MSLLLTFPFYRIFTLVKSCQRFVQVAICQTGLPPFRQRRDGQQRLRIKRPAAAGVFERPCLSAFGPVWRNTQRFSLVTVTVTSKGLDFSEPFYLARHPPSITSWRHSSAKTCRATSCTSARTDTRPESIHGCCGQALTRSARPVEATLSVLCTFGQLRQGKVSAVSVAS